MDALLPAVTARKVKIMATLAAKGAEATRNMTKATHGRTSYLTSGLVGVPDPGA
eukprot:CAMPEP_0201285498 /NCGR_PEP_ID=MMETSP1317-20130820/109548_1 /ASSEMBLY_ACC=CAM_ASM_000770 /TAXON_ID=187299 /ORGANISM="Undescribed Undescribed, Strain Undescribed" /LENGTH=53 /DNA_ID=CAMNT_0047610601 /DNA_START=224 /DNA_END=382 /DNA_ORIENTATION=+